MRERIGEVIISEEQISQIVNELGERISTDYSGTELVVIGVLKGGFMFLSDLVRKINVPLGLDFISVSSYGKATKSSGVVRIIKDIDIDITNKHVLIVEDIVDTGLTLNHLKELFYTKNPASIKTCTLLDKPSKRKIAIETDYKGIVIPDRFVVGYGIDYSEKYRNLPSICTLEID